VDVYTLEVTPEESEKLALAATEGTLNFALRNEADQESVLTNGADTAATLASLRPVRVRTAPDGAPRAEVVVEVIRGASRARMRF
jgi:pilus assembly protein CpaB